MCCLSCSLFWFLVLGKSKFLISSGSSETVGDILVRTERTVEFCVEEGVGGGKAHLKLVSIFRDKFGSRHDKSCVKYYSRVATVGCGCKIVRRKNHVVYEFEVSRCFWFRVLYFQNCIYV